MMQIAKSHVRTGLALVALAFACSGARSTNGSALTAPQPSAASVPVVAPAPVAAAPLEKKVPPISKAPYGKVGEQEVELYTLQNASGLVVKAINYGAIITELHVPDKAGKSADVVLGFGSLDGYVQGSQHFGATVGRIANRIRNAKFKLEGKEYTLAANEKPHNLHGGNKGWDKAVWTAEMAETVDGPQVRFTYSSKDGEEGFPGNVTAKTIYTLTHDNALRVEMQATTDKTTIVNMVHHGYWNLAGHDSGPIFEQELTLFGDQYTPGDPLVPTGAIAPVKGTPFDFTIAKAIGKDLKAAGGKPIGFDHNYLVRGEPNTLRPVARLRDPKSGRVLTVEANQPGVQFYSGNFLDGTAIGKNGAKYAQYTGLCLETQKFPNAINVPAWRDQVILKPGQSYEHIMLLRFTNE